MGRNGALSIEEWRPCWPPSWDHSTNLLNMIAHFIDRFDFQIAVKPTS
jgi:hypothetical protein